MSIITPPRPRRKALWPTGLHVERTEYPGLWNRFCVLVNAVDAARDAGGPFKGQGLLPRGHGGLAYVKRERFMDLAERMQAGASDRAIMAATGASWRTLRIIRRVLADGMALRNQVMPRCPCGRPTTHAGRCWARIAAGG